MIIIYISGIDGCGKTTQATHLVNKLKENGISVEYQWLRWEPSIVNSLKVIKKLLGKNTKSSKKAVATNEKADSKWSSLKYRLMKSAAFRKLWLTYASNDYFKAYKKAIQNWNSDVVIMDRYIFDFLVDQSINFNIPVDKANTLFKKTKISKMHNPDFNIIIDITAETGFKRKMDGTSTLYLEQRAPIYSNFKNDNVLHIDGTKEITDIQEIIYNWINEQMELNK